MAEMTHEDIERIWNSFSHYVPDRQKSDAAVEFVNTLKDMSIDEQQIKASSEYDPKLEEAVDTVFENEDENDYDNNNDDELVY